MMLGKLRKAFAHLVDGGGAWLGKIPVCIKLLVVFLICSVLAGFSLSLFIFLFAGIQSFFFGWAWNDFWPAVSAVASCAAFCVALLALRSWRQQEKEKRILAWKSSILEYTYTLPYLDDKLSWPKDKIMIETIAGKFYDCIKCYMLMVEYIPEEKMERYKLIWTGLHDAHQAYCMNGGSGSDTKKVFIDAYLEKYL